MKNIIVSFTDAYGLQHTEAVFELNHGYKNVSQIEIIGTSGSTQQIINVDFQFKYWHSRAAKEAGALPIPFADKNGQQTFGANPTSETDVLNLEQYCLEQLINTVLPSIDPAFVVEQPS